MIPLTSFKRFLCVCGVLCLFAVGCSDTEETREVDFSLSRYSVGFPVEGGTTNVTVAVSGNWSASTDVSWLTLDQDDNTLYITATANDQTTDVRETDVVVVADSYGSETIQVRQEPAEAPTISITYGSSDHTIDSEGGSYTVIVSSNYDWTASLEEDIDGWELTTDHNTGKVSVSAEANSGNSITGTILITAGEGSLIASEEVAVTQISRAENKYYQYTGYWLVNSADCCLGGEWQGEGVFNSCTIAEYSYPSKILSLIDWGYESLRLDRLQFKDNATVIVPGGFLCGSGYASGYQFYMYLVAFDADIESFDSSMDFLFTISEDGESIEVSGLTDEYPVIGYIGYSIYLGYRVFGNLPFCKAPITLIKSEGTDVSSFSAMSGDFSFSPVSELPEGIPDRLTGEFVGGKLNTIEQ